MDQADSDPSPWLAPERVAPLQHTLSLPGSKSLTNRELVLAALADGPSRISKPLHSRDTRLMMEALRALGATITEIPGTGEFGPDLEIEPIRVVPSEATIQCGLAGTVMRFIPPLAALFPGLLHFDGDLSARRRPMNTTLDALSQLGVQIEDSGRGTLPFTTRSSGTPLSSEVRIDASASSQFVSGLLLMAARLPEGLHIIHTGESIPSLPHIDMTIECLRARGVRVNSPEPGVWRVQPGPISAVDVEIEPDLSNAAPFLAASLVAGGSVEITGWPAETTQVGADVPRLLTAFGAVVTQSGSTLRVHGGIGWRHGGTIKAVDMDLSHAGELAPTFIALATLAEGPSFFRGIGHIRGHETDRLAALVRNIQTLGGKAAELPDGIQVIPTPLDGGVWQAFEDHRIATSGALLGLGVRGISVDDIGSTSKTLPEFPELWHALVESAAP